MPSLLLLPPDVLNNVLYFLPQQLLVALALSNFHFYEPCLRKLYKTLVVRVEPTLAVNKTSERRRDDFVELSVTTICGFQSQEMSRKAHVKMIEARLRTLITSISVNLQLAQYIETVEVLDAFSGGVRAALGELFGLLAGLSNTISKIYIADAKLREQLHYSAFKFEFPLTSVTIERLLEISKLRAFKLKELIVADVKDTDVTTSDIPLLKSIEHILVRSDLGVFNAFSLALGRLYQSQPFVMAALNTFTVVHSHENTSHGYPYVDFATIENFQISLGCNDKKCDQECLGDSLARFEFKNLKRLAVVQSSDFNLSSHKNTEKWDLTVFEFVKTLVEESDSLFYLSIRHNVPLNGIIDDGYEGNYVRKVKLYTGLLPNLLATVQRHVVNLVLPNLVASFACYEQPMNTFLWNGCKCVHCETHLQKLDEYLLHHRYYNFEKEAFKDMLTVQMMRTMSEVLSDRMMLDDNVGDLFQLSRPMRNMTWNFHNSKFSIPFRCLSMKTYEIADWEDEKAEKSEKSEKFFDAEEHENDCQFLHEKFYPNYLIVISHYLDDLIRKMINLNRGDAEDIHIGSLVDENDGFTNLRINKMLINGIDYNFDHEMNGTIFFRNLYDDVPENNTSKT